MTEIAFPAGTVAALTGAGGGIGSATAKRFAEAGADVALIDAHAGVHDVVTRLRAEFPDRRFEGFVADIADPASMDKVRAEVVEAFGRVDHLGLIAGVIQDAHPVEDLPVEEWDRVFGVNARGVFLGARAFIPDIKKQDVGSITAISSFWARTTPPYFAAYAASKAVVLSLVKTMAGELAEHGIRVNSVAPGQINTTMHRTALEDEAKQRGITFEELKAFEWGKVPLGVAGEPEVIADAVVFLSSPAASYITGASLDVNGGVVFH